jgi:predicted transposase YbfD/YdcC
VENPNLALKGAFFDCFSLIDDPRAANAAHPLVTVLFCLVVGVICGGDGFVQAEHFARLKRKFIERYVPLKKGKIPTHDTMARLLADIDPDQFVSAFALFMERISGHSSGDIINLDGKTLRGVVGKAALKRADAAEDQAHIVSAFSTLRCIVLGQLRSLQVANEVEAAQELLQILDIKNAVVTMDAAHAAYRTLEIIAEQSAHVVVTVKTNTAKLHGDIISAFHRDKPTVVETNETTRGGIERRRYEVVPASGPSIDENFGTLKSFVRVTRENVSHSSKSQEAPSVTFYASSMPPSQAKKIAESVRARWGIENKLHYVLDVTFDEDRSRIRAKNAPENFARIRHIALNLLGLLKTPNLSFALKRGTALADDRYLARALRLKVA